MSKTEGSIIPIDRSAQRAISEARLRYHSKLRQYKKELRSQKEVFNVIRFRSLSDNRNKSQLVFAGKPEKK